MEIGIALQLLALRRGRLQRYDGPLPNVANAIDVSDASEVGEVFEGFRPRPLDMHEDQEGNPNNAFQTRVYDHADLRKYILKKELPPMPQDINLN